MEETRPTEPGYSALSVWIHWLSTLMIIIMFVSGAQGEPLISYHITWGALVGFALVIRVFYRLARGLPEPSDEKPSAIKNLTIWMFLLTILFVVISGILFPWSQGLPVEILNLSFSTPTSNTYLFAIPAMHKAASYLLLPLLVVHIVYSFEPERMFSSTDKGH